MLLPLRSWLVWLAMSVASAMLLPLQSAEGTMAAPLAEVAGEPAVAGLKIPSVMVPLIGGLLQSKRKLYSVPQRSALALWLVMYGVVDQRICPALTTPGQSVPLQLTLPAPSPSW